MLKLNREHIMNTTTPDERSEKEGLAREPRELSSEELESIIGGVEVGIGIGSGMEEVEEVNILEKFLKIDPNNISNNGKLIREVWEQKIRIGR